MKTLTLSALFFALIFVGIGCSGGKNPAVPGEERNAQDFFNAIEIFGLTTSEDDDPVAYDFNPLYHDIALAQLVEVGTWPGQEHEYNHGCIAVTLNRQDNDPANPFKPVFRWLHSDNYIGDRYPIFYVTLRDDIDSGANASDYRALACDAIYVPDGLLIDNIEDDSIEVVVAYMVRNRWQGDDNWDIEVTAMQWTDVSNPLTPYWLREPNYRIPWQFSDLEVDITDEFNPDIAYYRGPDEDTSIEHRYGPADIFLVYTDQEDEGGNEQHINWRHYIRYWNRTYNEWRGQSLDGHNGYDPSIDVGLIDVGLSSVPWVVIAYTSQFHAGHTGYHVCVTAWMVTSEDQDRNTLIPLQNHDHMYQDAGLPCLDIAPDWNGDHVAVLSYTQVTGADGFGPTTDTFVVRFLGNIADLEQHIRVVDPGPTPMFADSLYSSIAVNRQASSGTDIYASLAFMGQCTSVDTTDNWHPRVAVMRIRDTEAPFFEGVIWSDWADQVPIYTILGNYNLSDIPFQNPGVATAIVTFSGNNYWASWNDRIEMEPPPMEVWASWGSAG